MKALRGVLVFWRPLFFQGIAHISPDWIAYVEKANAVVLMDICCLF
jgi:hypothetical protein